MKLTVVCPHKQIFEGQVKQVSIPTEIGEITVLPQHMPLVTILTPGLIKALPEDTEKFEDKTFVFEEQYIALSTSEGIAYIDGDTITIMAASAKTNTGTYSEEQLQKQKKELEEKINQYNHTKDKEKIKETTQKIQTIEADIKLIKLQTNND